MSTPSVPALMSLAEVAKELRLPVSTLYHYRYTGIGPRCFKLGRAVLYERADVLAWVAEQKRLTASGGPARPAA